MADPDRCVEERCDRVLRNAYEAQTMGCSPIFRLHYPNYEVTHVALQ